MDHSQRISDSDLCMAVRDAVLRLAATLEPDEQYDPASDRLPGNAVRVLGELLGSNAAAEGVQLALGELLRPE